MTELFVTGTDDAQTAAANTAVTITKTGIVGKRWACFQVVCGYDAAPTGGSLKIEDGAGNTIFEVPITAAGPEPLNFDPPKLASEGNNMIFTLAAGGAGIVGYLNVTVNEK